MGGCAQLHFAFSLKVLNVFFVSLRFCTNTCVISTFVAFEWLVPFAESVMIGVLVILLGAAGML